jgi:formylglycine-generating enzyme required for sulfatase activity
MRKPLLLLFTTLTVFAIAEAHETPDGLVLIEGGAFKHTKSAYYAKNVTISDFYIGKYEVTQKEWADVIGSNPSTFQADSLPVETVSWYDCVDYCNQRSLKEGLTPYYTIDKINRDPKNENDNDDVKWTVSVVAGANGYRLPTEAEWEYAASGGQMSKSYTYSGGNNADAVSWYWENSGDDRLGGAWNWPAIEKNNNRTKPVGGKAPNELGLYDMSGNVREWCWDWSADSQDGGAEPKGGERGSARIWKGGGWMGADFCGQPAFRASYEAHNKGNDQGFRVCRSR